MGLCAACTCTPLVPAWQVGGLIKRLDVGEGSYAKELEEDFDVAEQLDQVLGTVRVCLGGGGHDACCLCSPFIAGCC
jgi:hypothetical protein